MPTGQGAILSICVTVIITLVVTLLPLGALGLWGILAYRKTGLAATALKAWAAERGHQVASPRGTPTFGAVAYARVEGVTITVKPGSPWPDHLMVSAESRLADPGELILLNGVTAWDVRHMAKWEGPSFAFLSRDATFDSRALTIVEDPERVRVAVDPHGRAALLGIARRFGLFLKGKDVKLMFCEPLYPYDASVADALDRALTIVATLAKLAAVDVRQAAPAPQQTCPYCRQLFPAGELRCPNCNAAVQG